MRTAAFIHTLSCLILLSACAAPPRTTKLEIGVQKSAAAPLLPEHRATADPQYSIWLDQAQIEATQEVMQRLQLHSDSAAPTETLIQELRAPIGESATQMVATAAHAFLVADRSEAGMVLKPTVRVTGLRNTMEERNWFLRLFSGSQWQSDLEINCSALIALTDKSGNTVAVGTCLAEHRANLTHSENAQSVIVGHVADAVMTRAGVSPPVSAQDVFFRQERNLQFSRSEIQRAVREAVQAATSDALHNLLRRRP